MTWHVILVSDMDDLAAIIEPPADPPEPLTAIPEPPAARVDHCYESPYYNFTPQQKSQTSVKVDQLETHNKDNVEEIKKQFEVYLLHIFE